MTTQVYQQPPCGRRLVHHKGDTIRFILELPAAAPGTCWLRTNIGRARVHRDEIIANVESGAALLALDWRDIPMARVSERSYALELPLLEVGRFEAKAFFLPEDTDEPLWPQGDNVVIKVEPAHAVCANSIYTAFVRQFGPNKVAWAASNPDAIRILEKNGYSVIPRSGTFRDLIEHLDFILHDLRFRIIQLLPIHPTPTTYARMGRFGSPFASLDFLDVDPALTVFDRRTTPLEQFGELTQAIHGRGGRLFLDIPINHTGWASRLQIEHPEWFARDKDRSFLSPGAWGVTWEDLAKLDYRHRELWTHMAGVFLFWCRHGVDGFRCDAGYMVPRPVWEYIVAKVRQQYPDTLFLLEGLGGKLSTVEELLDAANLDWAYSELFQNTSRQQIESSLAYSASLAHSRGILVHYAETHDNNRLAATSTAYARLRTALTALCADNGAFGITNGLEWFAQDKIDVHGAPPLQWNHADNQVERIARLNALFSISPCCFAGATLSVLPGPDQETLALVRSAPDNSEHLLVLANLNADSPREISWQAAAVPAALEPFDLLSASPVTLADSGGTMRVALAPGQVQCLSTHSGLGKQLDAELAKTPATPERSRHQQLRALALEIQRHFDNGEDVADVDAAVLAARLAQDPPAFCREISGETYAPVSTWTWPQDTRRVVMLPPHGLLYVLADHPFHATCLDRNRAIQHRCGIRQDDGRYFTFIHLPSTLQTSRHPELEMIVYDPAAIRHVRTALLRLSADVGAGCRMQLSATQLDEGHHALCTNNRGGMSRPRAIWSTLRSQYDALLAANPDPNSPVDRRVLLTRCRAWLVCRGYSQALDDTCLESFWIGDSDQASWLFLVPAGRGKTLPLEIHLQMVRDQNAVHLTFVRRTAGPTGNPLADDAPVTLILRPDIEDRSFHAKTKAYAGPESAWPGYVTAQDDRFVFAPPGADALRLDLPGSRYEPEPEWSYNVAHPEEGERGLDDHSDLFSPGYFSLPLRGGDACILTATTEDAGRTQADPADPLPLPPVHPTEHIPMINTLARAMKQFIVRRKPGQTVIAGYPWFLDWGRDTLICLRGLIAAGMHQSARDILGLFAHYEKQGTLPNMLLGQDDSNRDTSDAPLWFAVACRDLLRTEAFADLLELDCGGRTLREVLVSIVGHYRDGTPNGIRMDADSGLIFSPSHFTWMDTDHPAGTPREGYPVEIQALWVAALDLVTGLDDSDDWSGLARRASASLERFFRVAGPEPWLADCLHARPGQAAAAAQADDHLRPNQLLAITLGAVHDPDLQRGIVAACEALLVPGAIRSLADRPVTFPLPIRHAGQALNNPNHPYQGRYQGMEDVHRKPAYHNGTAWTWPFPSYPEALYRVYGEPARAPAMALLDSCADLLNSGCLGQIPEILDGDAPHTQRGCSAQAWGVTELYRVLAFLQAR